MPGNDITPAAERMRRNESTAARQHRTLTRRIVDRLAANDKYAVLRDGPLPGFGLRVYPSGARVCVVQTRCVGRSNRITVDRYGDVSPDQAHKEAARTIARIKAGEAPIPVALKIDPTMAELTGAISENISGNATEVSTGSASHAAALQRSAEKSRFAPIRPHSPDSPDSPDSPEIMALELVNRSRTGPCDEFGHGLPASRNPGARRMTVIEPSSGNP